MSAKAEEEADEGRRRQSRVRWYEDAKKRAETTEQRIAKLEKELDLAWRAAYRENGRRLAAENRLTMWQMIAFIGWGSFIALFVSRYVLGG